MWYLPSLPFITQPVDKVVEMFNDLWLNIRENKNTMSKWIGKLFEKLERVDDRVDNVELRLQEIKGEIINNYQVIEISFSLEAM